jgi:Rps23 Pro-64 3,4-dihydroxylase Tpa1-like proline 4-hydroxylase
VASYCFVVPQRYRSRKAVEALRKRFLSAKPFPHIALQAFLERAHYNKVKKALLGQAFVRRDTDFFSLSQTKDLSKARDKPLKAFLRFLRSEELYQFLNAMSGVETKAGHLDVLGFRYTDGDHLLCHNDAAPSRRIGYALNFSSLKRSDGGALCLFASWNNRPTRIVRRILPKENALVLLAVTPRSHHMVEEVLTTRTRLTIAGWFYA